MTGAIVDMVPSRNGRGRWLRCSPDPRKDSLIRIFVVAFIGYARPPYYSTKKELLQSPFCPIIKTGINGKRRTLSRAGRLEVTIPSSGEYYASDVWIFDRDHGRRAGRRDSGAPACAGNRGETPKRAPRPRGRIDLRCSSRG